MLWLALHLPRLPLERFAGAADSATPFAVSAGHGVVAANAAARACGARPGQALAAAHALAAGLVVRERDEAAERGMLEGLAAWAGQYTSRVSLEPPQALLLEVAGSLVLFGGLNALWVRIEGGIAGLGHQALLAAAPTPRAALWLARSGSGARVTDSLETHLGALGLDACDLSAEQTALLADLGLHTLGDCLRLPRAGLARRLGAAFLTRLDQALGRLPDPRPDHVPLPRFEARLELSAEVEQTEGLLFAVKRLLATLCGQLAAREAGVAALLLTLHHRIGETPLQLGLSAPTRALDKLTDLLRERLERVGSEACGRAGWRQGVAALRGAKPGGFVGGHPPARRGALAQPVVALTLSAEELLPLPGASGELFPGPRARAEAGAALLERLRARLGSAAVQGLAVAADHRPERAWHAVTPGEGSGAPVSGERPLWLLAAPLLLAEKNGAPWLEGPLRLAPACERIESGWWDGDDLRRDYRIARDRFGARYWVFRDADGWFLHGLFA